MFKKGLHPLGWVFLKLYVPVCLFDELTFAQALVLSIIATLAYTHIIGFFMGVKPVPALDLLTLYNEETAELNVESILMFNSNCSDKVEGYMKRQIAIHPKMRSIIVKFLGDYYYKEISVDEAYKLCCHK